ncbi:hypothetical protein FRC10_002559 [Ceratobasidium sp. 414]|nr:hypothetical protein FRC10_002559 [Ceratobasidium sp. 414]
MHGDIPRRIAPNEMAIAAPALRHFEGSPFLVEAILQSDISTQIESLTIGVDWHALPGTAMLNLTRKPQINIPSLRTLCVKHNIDISDLKWLVTQTPMLEELKFPGYMNDMYGTSSYSLLSS